MLTDTTLRRMDSFSSSENDEEDYHVEEFLGVVFKLKPKLRKRLRMCHESTTSKRCAKRMTTPKAKRMHGRTLHFAAPQDPHFLLARTDLARWMMKVSGWLGTSSASFHLAVHVFDKYTEVTTLDLDKFQITGTVCMMLACKYHDRKFTSFEVLSNHFNLDEVAALEREVLQKLDFDLSFDTVFSCLHQSKPLLGLADQVFSTAEVLLIHNLCNVYALHRNPMQWARGFLSQAAITHSISR